jgi:hypothetical protein
MREVTCICESVYSNNLSRGKRYLVTDIDWIKQQVRIKGNLRTRWYPVYCFDFDNRPVITIQSYTIDDPIRDPSKAAIEVTITFTSGEQRFCLFMTPSALAESGDWMPETNLHYGSKHLIICNQITAENIDKVLHYIDSQNELIECSIPLH